LEQALIQIKCYYPTQNLLAEWSYQLRVPIVLAAPR
jgi:hypothetical protein